MGKGHGRPKKAPLPSKDCSRCGRPFTWRKKWARDWPCVIYCSDRCRKQGQSSIDDPLEARILARLAQCPANQTLSVTVLLKDLGIGPGTGEQAVRSALRRLASRQRMAIMQNGVTVAPERVRGLLQLKRFEPKDGSW